MAIDPKIKQEVIDLWNRGQKLSPPITLAEIGKHFGMRIPSIKNILENGGKHIDRCNQIKQLIYNIPSKEYTAQAESSGHIVLVIPDMHHPFAHPDALAFLKAVVAKYAPTRFVCLGDEIDACAFSKYPKDPDGLAPGLEITRAREALIPFYLEFPEMLVCESNHTVRPWKMAFQQGLPSSFLPTYATFLHAPDGWVWKHSHEIDGVKYIHGEGRSGFNAHIQFMRGYKQSVVIGHIHSYAAVSHEGGLFAVNSGCLIDTGAYCFKYAKNMPIAVSIGCSIVHHGKRAEFIPLHADSGGRWTGEL